MGKEHDSITAMLDLVTRHALDLSQFIPRGNPQGLQAALAVVGYLIDGKNKFTGDRQDIYYLTEEARKGLRFAEILGANTHLADNCGTPLHIGDTVVLHDGNMEVETPVLESFQKQQVKELDAVKNLGFTEALQSGFLEDCDITVHSCLEAYRESPLFQPNPDAPDEEVSCPQQ